MNRIFDFDFLALLDEFSLPLLVFTACYVFVLLAIIADLISGIRKAVKAGQLRTSYMYRRTVEKLAKYYDSLFAVGVIDLFIMMVITLFQHRGWWPSVPLFPPVTVFAGAYISFVEAKSVFEKLEDKDKRRLTSDLSSIANIVKDKDKMDRIADILVSLDAAKPASQKERKGRRRDDGEL